MERTVRLNDVESVVERARFPMTVTQARDRFEDLTLELADGTVSFSETIEQSHETRFDTAEDLVHELFAYLPRRAVGEPFQSEGDA